MGNKLCGTTSDDKGMNGHVENGDIKRNGKVSCYQLFIINILLGIYKYLINHSELYCIRFFIKF